MGRGLPVARGLAPVGSQSGPLYLFRQIELSGFTTASQPNGGEPPRHGIVVTSRQHQAGSPGKKVEREFEGMLYNFRVFFDRMTFPIVCEVSYDCYRQYRLRRRFSSQRPDR
ncbi:hypothetical protein BZL43_23555 [Pseudomonas sp. PICF141]|nr:hypothetical protein BZL43_23555 [Pseudomonas sp. PICF141]